MTQLIMQSLSDDYRVTVIHFIKLCKFLEATESLL